MANHDDTYDPQHKAPRSFLLMAADSSTQINGGQNCEDESL
jgi:hypothetical protein